MAPTGLRALLSICVALSPLLMQPGAHAASGAASAVVDAASVIPQSCFKHPYSVSATMSPDFAEATLRVDVTGPLGEAVDSEIEFLTPAAGTSQHLNFFVFFCDGDRLGTYTISTTLDVYDAEYVRTTGAGSTTTFTYSAPPPVQPQPTATPTPVISDVDGEVQRIRTYDGRTIKFRLVAFPTPSGTHEGKPLVWAYKIDDRKPRKVTQGARDTFTYSREFRFHSGRHRVIIWKNGTREATLKIHVR